MSQHPLRVASRITGIGKSVPEGVVPNSYFSKYLETSDEWIRERTGIAERRWVEPQTPLSLLCEPAAREAIAKAGLTVDDIDGIVCGTVTPDYLFPGAACCLQKRLGMTRGFAFDVNAVCSGFVYALATADSLISRGLGKHVLVVGADIFSTIIDPKDRSTCVLFGDGAGVAVLSRVADEKQAATGNLYVEGDGKKLRGLYAHQLHADGSQGELLSVARGTASALTPEFFAGGQHYLHMAGREVFRFAVRAMVDICRTLPERCGFALNDVAHIITHQANLRILAAATEQLGISADRFPMNVQKYGNTSGGSVPLLLAEVAESGRLKEGDLVLLVAFGAGLTWGGTLLRW